MNEKIYTTEQAAKLMQSNEQTIRKLINTGEIKAYKKLAKWYILHSDIINYLKK